MIKTIAKKYLQKSTYKLYVHLGGVELLKYLFYKRIKKLYKISFNNIAIYFRPYISSDISGVIEFLNYQGNTYLDHIGQILNKQESTKPICFFDLGSNIGLDSLKACTTFNNVSVIHAIEMDLDNLKMTRLNLNQFRVNLLNYINKAVWTESGLNVEYSVENEPNAFSISTNKAKGLKKVSLTISLDDLFINQSLDNQIVILKMDIEGAEKNIFQLGEQSWLNFLDFFYIEHHNFNSDDINRLICIVQLYDLRLIRKYDFWSYPGWGGMLFGKVPRGEVQF